MAFVTPVPTSGIPVEKWRLDFDARAFLPSRLGDIETRMVESLHVVTKAALEAYPEAGSPVAELTTWPSGRHHPQGVALRPLRGAVGVGGGPDHVDEVRRGCAEPGGSGRPGGDWSF